MASTGALDFVDGVYCAGGASGLASVLESGCAGGADQGQRRYTAGRSANSMSGLLDLKPALVEVCFVISSDNCFACAPDTLLSRVWPCKTKERY